MQPIMKATFILLMIVSEFVALTSCGPTKTPPLGQDSVAAVAHTTSMVQAPQEIMHNTGATEPILSRAELDTLAANAELMGLLDRSASISPSPVIEFGESDRSERDLAGYALPRRLELLFDTRYPGIRSDSGPSVFAIGKLPLPSGRVGYVLLVPGMYSSTRRDLWIFDPRIRQLINPVELSEHWGDAGEEFSFKSWLVNFGSTSPDLVTHQCSTYNDMESDTSATTLQGEQLSMRHWTGSGFGPSTTEVTPALKSRFAEGPEACLKGK